MDASMSVSPEKESKTKEDRRNLPPPPFLLVNCNRPKDFSDKCPTATERQVEIALDPIDHFDQSGEGDGFQNPTTFSQQADRLEEYDVFTKLSGDGHDFEDCTSFSEPADQSDGYDAFAELSGAAEGRGPWALVLDIATREPFFASRHTPCTIEQLSTSLASASLEPTAQEVTKANIQKESPSGSANTVAQTTSEKNPSHHDKLQLPHGLLRQTISSKEIPYQLPLPKVSQTAANASSSSTHFSAERFSEPIHNPDHGDAERAKLTRHNLHCYDLSLQKSLFPVGPSNRFIDHPPLAMILNRGINTDEALTAEFAPSGVGTGHVSATDQDDISERATSPSEQSPSVPPASPKALKFNIVMAEARKCRIKARKEIEAGQPFLDVARKYGKVGVGNYDYQVAIEAPSPDFLRPVPLPDPFADVAEETIDLGDPLIGDSAQGGDHPVTTMVRIRNSTTTPPAGGRFYLGSMYNNVSRVQDWMFESVDAEPEM